MFKKVIVAYHSCPVSVSACNDYGKLQITSIRRVSLQAEFQTWDSRKYVFTNFRPSQQLTVDVKYVLALLHCVDVGNVASVFRIEARKTGDYLCVYIGSRFEKSLVSCLGQ
jgi:hypothetical protein